MLERSYPITKFTVFIGTGHDFLQCCLASFQFVAVATIYVFFILKHWEATQAWV